VWSNTIQFYAHINLFDVVLEEGGFKESIEVDLGSDTYDISTDGYDYLSDSDLDSDSDNAPE
jgi:hypothetical protein